MQLVTLVTDWGTQDHFVGVVKAKLYSGIPDVQVVDISHNIKPFNIAMAAFVVKNACLNFPENTIHIIDIDSVETKENTHVLIEYNKQYYISTDNGLPSLVFPCKPDKIIQLDIHQDSSFFTFAGLDLFCKVAIQLSNGNKPEEFGTLKDEFLRREFIRPTYRNNCLRATIIYIDNYGNAYLNVTDKEFEEYCNNRRFELNIRNHTTDKLSTSYNDVAESGMILTFSSTGYLQIAINKGSIAQLEGLKIGDSVTFEFN